MILIGNVISDKPLNLSIDLNDNSNWFFNVLEESFKQGGVCECRIIINDSDIK